MKGVWCIGIVATVAIFALLMLLYFAGGWSAIGCYLQAARIFHHQLNDQLQAQEIYQRVLDLDHGNESARQALRR
ncbi:MAG: hypothetical protein QXT19_02205 [Candidatus Woesearchaeota archaeon]